MALSGVKNMKRLMSLRRAATSLVLAAVWFTPFMPARADYVLTELTKPGAASMGLFDINNNGVMVGYSAAGVGPTDYSQALIYDGANFTTLSGPAGSISSAALGISDGGTVVGNYYSSAVVDGGTGEVVFGPSSGFLYSGGSYTTLTIAGANDTFLRGISADGRYVSGYYSTDAAAGIGFVYDTLAGTLATLSAPNSLQTIAQGINSAGIVVGSDILRGDPTTTPPTPTTRPAFTYDIATGTRTDQSIAGANRTAFRDIDDAGTITGWFRDPSNPDGTPGPTHAFIGSVADFEQLDFAGAFNTFGEGSNNAGIVVGSFFYSADDPVSHAFVATPVADPATLLQQLASDVTGVGPGNSLADKVELAEVYYAANDIQATCAVLADFLRQVEAQRGKKLTAQQADDFTAQATAIMDAIGCSE